MPELRPLWEVQLLDEQRRELEQKLREGQMSEELKALKNEIEEGRTVFNRLKEEYSLLKKKLKEKEFEASAAAEQAESLGQKLYGGVITNIKEISSSTKKLENLKSMIKKTEDEMLGIMERQDVLREKLEEMSALLNKKSEEFRRQHGSFLANQQKVRGLLAQIPLARQKLLEKIDAEVWHRYLEMKKKFSDPLARVEKGTCMGCRVGISFDALRRLKMGDGLIYCSNCGRMLFWER
ncbi:MAG TPA: C4-type zinc ribbon domain-containing protein [Bacillota bacterium]|nr:C4-type zinc ribbon domain-containing protein [Bacillota bacterium]